MTLLLALTALGAVAAVAAAAGPLGGNGRVAFRLNDDLYVMNADGSNLRPVFVTADEEEDPGFSPDGRFLAFSRGEGDSPIFLGDLNTGTVTQLTFPTGAILHGDPRFSPDGSQIAFSCDITPGGSVNLRLCQMNRNGTGLVQLSSDGPGVFDSSPGYSPDGTRIALTRGTGQSDIFLMNAAGGSELNLTPTLPRAFSPDFSPDGSRILFSYDGDPGMGNLFKLATIPAAGGGVSDLTPGSATFIGDGAFSGDGKQIYFLQTNGPEDDVMVMPASGGAATNLTPSLAGEDATDLAVERVYRCAGRRATIVGDDGPDTIKGTKKADVIVSNAGKDKVRGRGGNDRICGGRGKDTIGGGTGRDRLLGQAGKDNLRGNAGVDVLKGGKGKDSERQ